MITSKNSANNTPPSPDDFVQDAPFAQPQAPAGITTDLIAGVTVTPLVAHGDHRGSLTELLTMRDGDIEPIVHIYQVEAKAGSVRAWVYHRHQFDRLAYTQGRFKVVLFDIRRDSPTFNKLSVLTLGKENPALLRIPPFVAHGVKNIGDSDSTFVNLPTKVYDPANPDKSRIAPDDPRIPFSFND